MCQYLLKHLAPPHENALQKQHSPVDGKRWSVAPPPPQPLSTQNSSNTRSTNTDKHRKQETCRIEGRSMTYFIIVDQGGHQILSGRNFAKLLFGFSRK
jgi:ribonuclease PH